MNAEEYAQLGADTQAAIGGIVSATAPTAKVLLRDPVNLDETQWLGSLKSDTDLDAAGDKRVHAWLVTFAGTTPEETTGVRDIEPTFKFDVQFFLSHEFGTDADSSEKRARAEILKVQHALAAEPHFETAGVTGIARHKNLTMPVKLGRLGGEIIHRGRGELSVLVQPLRPT